MFINLTPHDINVYNQDLTEVLVVIKPHGVVARVDSSQRFVKAHMGVPLYEQTFGDIVGLDGFDDGDDYLIVSALAASAAKNQKHPYLNRLLTVNQAVRKDGTGTLNLKMGDIVGCLGFALVS